MHPLLAFFTIFVLAIPLHNHGQDYDASNERESDALKKFDFFENYGNRGKEFDVENSILIFLHENPADGTLTYKSFRIEERVPEENVLEYHLSPESRNTLTEKFSEEYPTHDDTQREFNKPKAIDSFVQNHRSFGSHLISGFFRYKRDRKTAKVIQIDRFLVGEKSDGTIIYRVETTVPDEPFDYDMRGQIPPFPEHMRQSLDGEYSVITEEIKQMISEFDKNDDATLNFEEFKKWSKQYVSSLASDLESSRLELEKKGLRVAAELGLQDAKMPEFPEFELIENLIQSIKTSLARNEKNQKQQFMNFDEDETNSLSVVEFSDYLVDLTQNSLKALWSDTWSHTFEWKERKAKPDGWESIDVFEPTNEEWRLYREQRRLNANLRSWSQEYAKLKDRYIGGLHALKELSSKNIISAWDTSADGELSRDELKNWLDQFAEAIAAGMDATPAVFSEQDLPDTLIRAANAVKDHSPRIEFEEEREERFANFDSDDSNTLSAVEFVEYLTDIFSD